MMAWQDDYDVAWHGALWRSFPQPTVGTLKDEVPVSPAAAEADGRVRDRVWAALTGEWQSIRALSAATGVEYRQTWRALQILVREDRVEEWNKEPHGRIVRPRGMVVRLYRRAR